MPIQSPDTGTACTLLALVDDVHADAEEYQRRLGTEVIAEDENDESLRGLANRANARAAGQISTEALLFAWLTPDSFDSVLLAEAAQQEEEGAVEAAARVAERMASIGSLLPRIAHYRARLGLAHSKPSAGDPRGLIDALVEAGHGSRADVAALPFREALEINARAAFDAQELRRQLETNHA